VVTRFFLIQQIEVEIPHVTDEMYTLKIPALMSSGENRNVRNIRLILSQCNGDHSEGDLICCSGNFSDENRVLTDPNEIVSPGKYQFLLPDHVVIAMYNMRRELANLQSFNKIMAKKSKPNTKGHRVTFAGDEWLHCREWPDEESVDWSLAAVC
jgi:hypothetical protein